MTEKKTSTDQSIDYLQGEEINETVPDEDTGTVQTTPSIQAFHKDYKNQIQPRDKEIISTTLAKVESVLPEYRSECGTYDFTGIDTNVQKETVDNIRDLLGYIGETGISKIRSKKLAL